MPSPAMPSAASKTSQRCSMARRMMRSNMSFSLALVAVLGATLAEFRLQDETARRCIRGSSLHPAHHFDEFAIGTAQSHRLGNEAIRHLDKYDALVTDRLDGFGQHTDRNLGLAGNNFDIHEQAGTPGHLRVGQDDPCLGSARILPEQGTDVG